MILFISEAYGISITMELKNHLSSIYKAGPILPFMQVIIQMET